jgi:DNA-binding response OmpR family regulator
MKDEGKIKILIVDDEKNMCEIMENYLHEEGYDAISVNNGKDALEFSKNKTPNLIILDIVLPDMDGYMFARALREDERTFLTPIIMISAKRKEYRDKLAGFISGACDYLTKPFDRKELLDSICKVLSL